MVLVATAMAVLLAGCGSSQREAQDSSQGSEQEESRSQQIAEAMMSEQTYELTTNETVVGSSQQTHETTTNQRLVGRCADSGSRGGQQEQASGGEVSNGKIAFTRNSDIHVIDGEGAHERRLTYTAQVSEDHPVWSPDGQKIAFTANKSGQLESALYVMNADGTNKTQLAADVLLWSPSWSPDGQKIVVTTSVEYEYVDDELSVINVDGTHKVSLSTAAPFSGNPNDETVFGSPVWSPTGNKIAFASRTVAKTAASVSPEPASATAEGLTGIYLINVDGTGLCKLTNTETVADGLVWSPDGEQIAFSHRDTIYVINTEGSGRKQLAEGYSAAWSPDGQKIAFANDSVLHVIDADGSGMRRLAKTTELIPSLTLPAWSPGGEKIAFPCPADQGAEATYHSDVCVINPDGTEWKRIALKGDTYSLSWGSE